MAAHAQLGRTPFAVVDLETTGIYTGGHDRVIEVAVIRYQPETGEIEDEYVTLVNPKRDIGRSDIHGITAADLLHAPEFGEVAGDIACRLNGAIVVGHNVRFDVDFLRSEYRRLGVEMPAFPCLCTLHLAYRLSGTPSRALAACCAAEGIKHVGEHTAYGDAQAVLDLLQRYLHRAGSCALCDLGCEHDEVLDHDWLGIAPSGRSVPRCAAAVARHEERGYLSRLVSRLPGTEGSTVREAEYLCLLDRVLEDRALTKAEAESLCAAATNWGMSQTEVRCAHQAYVWALSREAKADGVVTDLERRDLLTVCELLGVEAGTLDQMFPSVPVVAAAPPPSAAQNALAGKTVCFTGELLGRIDGEPISREMAEDFARKAGLDIKGSVSKKLDILVVADPDTQSGKAKKARECGTRIMAEATFWKAIGVAVE